MKIRITWASAYKPLYQRVLLAQINDNIRQWRAANGRA
jgi:hypothetical protein